MTTKTLLRVTSITVVCSLALLLPAQRLSARGGLQWGYVNQSQGYPLSNLWLQTSPWSQMSGWGIPQRNLGPPQLNQGPTPSGPTRGNPGNYIRRGPTQGTIGRPPQSSTGGTTRIIYVPTDRASNFPGGTGNDSPAPPSPAPNLQRYEPLYYFNYNAYWRTGYWGGGLWGWSRWGGEAGRMIFPRWSAGPQYYQSGYGQYQNPFMASMPADGPRSLNYSTPILPPFDEKLATLDPTLNIDARDDRRRTPAVSAGLKALDAARAAFAEKKFDEALKRTDQALDQMPRDPAVHEFRALVLFARGDYRQAAATIYAVLAVAPGWDWATLSSFYSDPAEMTRQLRQLETFRKQNPDSAEAAFLLAYHYVSCRHVAAARRQFQTAARLLPDDLLIPPLVALMAGASDQDLSDTAADDGSAGSPPPAGDPPTFDLVKLIGQWKAQRGPDTIELTIEDGGKFTWTVTEAGKSRRITGNYIAEGNLLQLESREKRLLGRITLRERGGFNFNLSANDPADPGLEFGK